MIPEKVSKIFRLIVGAGGKALLVGGCVRDTIRGGTPKDWDIEVYGLALEQIKAALTDKGFDVKLVGESFGVLKVDHDVDVSVPRRDNRVGVGHKDFESTLDPNMSIEDAASRRDFTINSLAMDELGQIFDFFGGMDDMRHDTLRATSPAFSEDALRVLRGMQFAGRFGMVMEEGTVQLCRDMMDNYVALPKERVFEEWWKWAAKSDLPSMGLDVLVETGWIALYPQLNCLQMVAQDKSHHPEGNVWRHTSYVCDEAADIARRDGLDETSRGILIMAALCHDLGKATTTVIEADGHITSRGHDSAGVEPTEAFLTSIGAPNWLKVMVVPLVREHMAHVHTLPRFLNTRVVRRLANRLHPANLAMWSRVCEADHGGRPPLPRGNPVLAWMDMAKAIDVVESKPRPILMGRHLLSLGMAPGEEMGRLIKESFEAQLDGVFTDTEGAIAWAKERTGLEGLLKSLK